MIARLEMTNVDAEEIYGALQRAAAFHIYRDRMNAELHLDKVRYSPLTLELIEARNLIDDIRSL